MEIIQKERWQHCVEEMEMKWERGRQLDSFKMTISAKDCADILNGNNKRLLKNALQMFEDYEKNNIDFKKLYKRNFNTSE